MTAVNPAIDAAADPADPTASRPWACATSAAEGTDRVLPILRPRTLLAVADEDDRVLRLSAAGDVQVATDAHRGGQHEGPLGAVGLRQRPTS